MHAISWWTVSLNSHTVHPVYEAPFSLWEEERSQWQTLDHGSPIATRGDYQWSTTEGRQSISSEFLVYEGKWWNTLRSLYFFQVNSLRPNDAYVSKIAVIGSDNGLSPDRRQPIIWTNAGILLIGPSGTNFREIVIEIHTFSFIWKCRLENNGHFVSVSMCCSGSLLFDGRFVTLERYWTPGLCYFLQCLTIYFSHRATLINMDFSKWSQ